MELFQAIKDDGMNFLNGVQKILDAILLKYPHIGWSKKEKAVLASKADNFLKKLKLYWKDCHYHYIHFISKRKDWLTRDFIIRVGNRPVPQGRPKKTFDLSGITSRKRKMKHVVSHLTLHELVFATKWKLRKCGNKDAANILQQLLNSPKRSTKIKKSYKKSLSEEPQQKFSPEEALSLFVSSQLTTFQYSLIRKSAIVKGVKLYPSYHALLSAKKSCYPEDILVNDYSAEIGLQSLIHFTIRRFFLIPNDEMFTFIAENDVKQLQYVVKWGCDGCGGLPRYKQTGRDVNNLVMDDSSILASSFVPLQLSTIAEYENQRILWQNPRTSSPRFCRPIRIRFLKETADELVKEISYIETQISKLVPTEVVVRGRTIEVIPKFLLTMIDGKVCNALASNAYTQRCYICGAIPKNMNKIEHRTEVNEETLSWGLSPLHAYIRFMECILHISYRLEVPKWMSRLSDDEKNIVHKKKEKVINDFREITGLLVDTPKQGGGNSNDGNTARRFFEDFQTTSQITGVDETLVQRFGIILKTLSCGHPINTSAFNQYTSDTARLYVSLYNWYPMPVTVHKVLVHGSEIIEKHLIPIGQLSEDVMEMQHKYFKTFRERNSRKFSRITTNTDVLHHLLISTDPLITSLRHLPPPKDISKLHEGVKTLLIDAGNSFGSSDESDDDFGLSESQF